MSKPLLPRDGELVIATHNAGKVREIGELLAPFALRVSSATAHGLPEPEENGATFAANAEIKARAAMEATGLPALADDSGLAVEALGGAPGIYSARWAGTNKDFALAMQRIHDELRAKGVPPQDWRAHFICDLCLCLPDGSAHHFEGRVDGTLTFPARGEHGFGYDPIFVPLGDSRTYAEMPAAEKHANSHRARAFRLFVDAVGK